MKRARALDVEPPLLAQYRHAYPQEEKRPADQAKETWDGFKTDQAAYAQVLRQLAEAQQGLCIYCEQRLVDATGALIGNDYQVEHVAAKSGAAGRVLDWTNMALACTGGTYPHHREPSRKFAGQTNTSCGQAKDTADLPPGCDPRGQPLVPALVQVGMDGRLRVDADACASAGLRPSDLVAALALLNLDCERLRKTRQDVGAEVRSWLVFMLEELMTAQLKDEQRAALVDLLVARRLQPDAAGFLPAFWSTTRSALGAPAGAWVATNQAQFA